MCSLEKRGRVFVLTLIGDGEHWLGHSVIDSIRAALARVRSESGDRAAGGGGFALVTTADQRSRFFSNGFDLGWANAAGSASFLPRLGSMVIRFAPVVADLLSLPMPTVAAITGHAAAAGFLLALSHDHRVMRSDRGVIYMSEMDIRLPFPDYFAAVMRAKIADPAALRDVAMQARKIGAAEAAERGIVDLEVGSAGETEEAAIRLAEGLAARGWDGGVYASVRRSMFPEACRVVDAAAEDAERKGEEMERIIGSKL